MIMAKTKKTAEAPKKAVTKSVSKESNNNNSKKAPVKGSSVKTKEKAKKVKTDEEKNQMVDAISSIIKTEEALANTDTNTQKVVEEVSISELPLEVTTVALVNDVVEEKAVIVEAPSVGEVVEVKKDNWFVSFLKKIFK